MNYQDAVNNMMNGKRLLRPSWSGYSVSILPNQSYIWSIPNSGDKPAINASIYVSSIDDILATDWVVKNN